MHIEKEAYEYLYNNNFKVVISIQNVNICWGTTPQKTPWIEVKRTFTDTENYNCFMYGKIFVFVHKNLIVRNDAIIKIKRKTSILNNKLAFDGIYLNK